MKDQAIVNNIFKSVRKKIETEVGGLLGFQLVLSGPDFRVVAKEDFFSLTAEKLILTRMAVKGERQGEVYLFATMKDAIFLGGTLLMLPPKELESRAQKNEFDEEIADAFGEIGNIISGVYTTIFDELYPKKLHFTKTGLETVAPTKVDLASATPIPAQSYYLISSAMKMEDRQFGEIQTLVPLEILGWTGEEARVADQPAPSVQAAVAPVAKEKASPPATAPPAAEESAIGEPPPAAMPVESGMAADLVLIVAEDSEDARPFEESLQELGLTTRILDYRDNVKEFLPPEGVRGAFLVMRDVNEQGIAKVIKIRSACGKASPLLAAGPNWTRTSVLQAVKYGACDIVVTPATTEEIKGKVGVHLKTGPVS